MSRASAERHDTPSRSLPPKRFELSYEEETDVPDVLVLSHSRPAGHQIGRRLRRLGFDFSVVAGDESISDRVRTRCAELPHEAVVINAPPEPQTCMAWVRAIRDVAWNIPVIILGHASQLPRMRDLAGYGVYVVKPDIGGDDLRRLLRLVVPEVAA